MPASLTEPNPEPAGLYVHVPFCSAVCPYCDFAVLVGGETRRRAFADALLQEIRLWGEAEDPATEAFRALGFDTIYFGGGTPSLLETEDLERILTALDETFLLHPGARLQFEANPEDISQERLEAWRALGVHTLSLGVQSFVDKELRALGRRHDSTQAAEAVQMALKAGFSTVSLDLIFGLERQTLETLRQSLTTATALAPQHISCYQLEIHPRTPFGKQQARGELRELSEAAQEDLFLLTHEHLSAAGLPAYEVSNFARAPEHRSRHNSKYWRHTPYLGLGPSAHSFHGRRRWWNERHLTPWQRSLAQDRLPTAGSESLCPKDLALEALMLQLRTTDGIDLQAFHRAHGIDLRTTNCARLTSWREQGLLHDHQNRLSLTPKGLALADGLAASLCLEE